MHENINYLFGTFLCGQLLEIAKFQECLFYNKSRIICIGMKILSVFQYVQKTLYDKIFGF